MEIREVTSDEDREKVFRLRYDVYITEMDRGTQGVDHKNRLLYDELDENCVMVGAFENGRAVGTVRVNHAWKTDIGEFTDLYSMCAEGTMQPDYTSIVTKFMIAEEKRNSSLALKLILWMYTEELRNGVIITYLDCNAHLIPLYAKLGFKTYKEDVESDEYGSITPMKLMLRDSAHLSKIRSPLRTALREFETGQINDYLKIIDGAEDLPQQQWDVDRELHAKRGENYIFDGLSEDELPRIFRIATSETFKAGEWIIQEGQISSDIFVMLDGQAAVARETADGNELVVALFSRGQVIGEMGYLRNLPRSASVRGISDGRVLRFSSAVMRSLLETDSAIAAKIFRNLSIILANRLAKTTGDWIDNSS